MTASQSANNSLLVSRAAGRGALGDALRLYVGRGRRYSVKQLSNATGVPDRIIECLMSDPEGGEYRNADMGQLLSLMKFLGAEFTTEWMRLADQGAYDLPDREETPPGALAADMADDTAAVVRAAADNVFCPIERTTLRPVGVRMMNRGAQLVGLAAA
jgi:hypothetical protein